MGEQQTHGRRRRQRASHTGGTDKSPQARRDSQKTTDSQGRQTAETSGRTPSAASSCVFSASESVCTSFVVAPRKTKSRILSCSGDAPAGPRRASYRPPRRGSSEQTADQMDPFPGPTPRRLGQGCPPLPSSSPPSRATGSLSRPLSRPLQPQPEPSRSLLGSLALSFSYTEPPLSQINCTRHPSRNPHPLIDRPAFCSLRT